MNSHFWRRCGDATPHALRQGKDAILHSGIARLLLIGLFAAAHLGCAQRSVVNQDYSLANTHKPTLEARFGGMNPEAPQETMQFEFLIGDFDCHDKLRQNDGSWTQSRSRWRAEYVLNGYAILDQYWNEQYAGISIRIFDPAKAKWRVLFSGAPPSFVGEWLGQKTDDNRMIMIQERSLPDGRRAFSRLTFYDIGRLGFEWRGELVTDDMAQPNWEISCRRAIGTHGDP